MKHLEYKDTNNKAYKAYYDKFKKMVKQDLNGDGWFLLVKDFPFKDGDNLMFTAGEDIGKWQDKNLVSLYGKTKYIIGRCRKKGPVLTLLHFQEGDYVKEATESGLRKELKEYFKGTGVSVRTFKSLKVTEKEPDIAKEDQEEEDEVLNEETTSEESTGASAVFEELEMPALKPAALKEMLGQAISMATSLGVVDEQEFIDRVNDFKKAIPRMAVMKIALGKLNDYLKSIEPPAQPETTTETPTGTGEASRIREEIARIEEEDQRVRKEILGRMNSLQEQLKKNGSENIAEHVGLVEESEKLLEQLIKDHLTRKTELETQLATL